MVSKDNLNFHFQNRTEDVLIARNEFATFFVLSYLVFILSELCHTNNWQLMAINVMSIVHHLQKMCSEIKRKFSFS